jgi:hypothetical protein
VGWGEICLGLQTRSRRLKFSEKLTWVVAVVQPKENDYYESNELICSEHHNSMGKCHVPTGSSPGRLVSQPQAETLTRSWVVLAVAWCAVYSGGKGSR